MRFGEDGEAKKRGQVGRYQGAIGGLSAPLRAGDHGDHLTLHCTAD